MENHYNLKIVSMMKQTPTTSNQSYLANNKNSYKSYYKVDIPRDEVDKYYDGLALERMVIMQNCSMLVVDQQFSMDYFLVPFYWHLIKEETTDDEEYNDFSKYCIAID